MTDFVVSIDDEATNELADNLSLVGRVNGVPCAIVTRLSSIAKLSKNQQKLTKQKALISSFLARQDKPVLEIGEKVTL